MHKNKLAQVFHFDLFGRREDKYDFLLQHSINDIQWSELEVKEPNFFFVRKDFHSNESYKIGFSIFDLFPVNSVGIVTSKDEILISDSKNELKIKIEDFYKVVLNSAIIKKIAYRLFDEKFIYYDVKLIDRARDKVMRHLFKPNLALSVPKQAIKGFRHVFISNTICDKNYIDSAGQFGAGNVFPLYLYPEPNAQQTIDQPTGRVPNLNMEIVNQIALKINHAFLEDENIVCDLAEGLDGTFYPLDILDYIYAVLHSPSYREKYKEFLKIDFPRVPYPKDKATFWQLVELGGEIRQIHLLESPVVNNFITKYPVGGSNEVGKVHYEILENAFGRVWINDKQYFANVPQVAWEFYIGGYQPAQKWLKDRKGRELQIEDILHYQKIIVALFETDRLMKEIDKIDL